MLRKFPFSRKTETRKWRSIRCAIFICHARPVQLSVLARRTAGDSAVGKLRNRGYRALSYCNYCR